MKVARFFMISFFLALALMSGILLFKAPIKEVLGGILYVIGPYFVFSIILFIIYMNLNRNPEKPLSVFGDGAFLFFVILAWAIYCNKIADGSPQDEMIGNSFYLIFAITMVVFRRITKNKYLA
jgi:predicted transporter